MKRVHSSDGFRSLVVRPSPANAGADAGRPDVPRKREANKQEKLRRIQQAAHELFVLQGYDTTTMREIAVRAGVALGTLFLYASNKRDLVFVIANDIMIAAVDAAAALVDDKAAMIQNLTAIAGVHFRTFGDRPELFRLVLRELLFYDSGNQAIRAVENRHRLLLLIQQVVSMAKRSGEVRPATEVELVARVFFAILQAEIRQWIASEGRELSSGLASFWAATSLVANGLADRTRRVHATKAEMQRVIARLDTLPAVP